ncbi:MAG: glycosyltransferase family 61 protein [Cloacibacterium sp.]
MNKFKSLIKKILTSETTDVSYTIKKIQITIYNFIYKKKLSVLKIENIHKLEKLKEIEPQLKFNSFEQKSLNQENKFKTLTIPSLNIFSIENPIININSSAIVKNGKLYFERINDNERFNEGNIKYHNKTYAVADISFDEIIEEGFFLGGNGCWNWYHYLIEILPKTLLLEETNCKTILISDDICNYPTMKQALEALINEKHYTIKLLNRKQNYKVKKLFFINEINKIEFNKINPNINNANTAYFREKYLYILREKLLLNYIKEENNLNKKIFLWRENTHRIAQNQNEVLVYLEKNGFEKIDSSTLTLEQQIKIFNSAEIIIGTTGAAWSNLIFCKQNTKAIIFSPIFFNSFNAFSNLAQIFNIDLTYSYYSGNKLDHSESNFRINLEDIKSILKSYE